MGSKNSKYETVEETYPHGALKSRTTYNTKGEKHGHAEGYHENGNLSFEGRYYKDKETGVHKKYSKKGLPISEIGYRQGVNHGNATIYHRGTEIIKNKRQWRTGKKQGTSLSFFRNGSLKSKCEYKKGKRIGVREEYFKFKKGTQPSAPKSDLINTT